MTQTDFISRLCKNNPDVFMIGSLGTISKDLEETGHEWIVPIKGAMGGAIGCGLGMALALPDEKFIVLIGDGSFLMKMGSISTVLKHAPDNLRIIILNNGCYRSCGGQKTNFKRIRRLIPRSIKVVNL